MPEIRIKQDSICIPRQLAEEVFPSTNAVFIKVYIHILLLCTKNNNVSFSAVANSLQLLESDVMQAVRFWESIGALELSDSYSSSLEDEQKEDSEPSDKSQHEVASEIEDDEKLSEMIQLAQEVFGRTLTVSEIKSLYWLYGDLGFSAEVILMLLEYCVSIDKKNMPYIERVASEWHKRGLNSIEKVQQFLIDEQQKKDYMYRVKQALAIHDRDLTGIEEEYIQRWHNDYGMSVEMISLAYEYCVLRINKLSFPYMDKIIKNWHEKEITSPDEARVENEAHKNSRENPDLFKEAGNPEDLERLTWGKLD